MSILNFSHVREDVSGTSGVRKWQSMGEPLRGSLIHTSKRVHAFKFRY